MEEVYHDGERAVQRQVGEERTAGANGRVITNTIIRGAINFIEKQPMTIVSSRDREGFLWSSLLIGDFGFVQVPTPTSLRFDENMIRSTPEDIFYRNIQQNPAIGSLFIELATRRRFRINGISSQGDAHIEISIRKAYPNCPKYIQRRVASLPDHFQEVKATTTQGERLDSAERAWIKGADTLFVGSRSEAGNMDVSHRGGPPGFIELPDDRSLKIPDYQGNSMYNTLGNIVQHSRVGILLIDFEQGQTLQLTGTAELLFEQRSEADLRKTTGTGRYWLFHTERWVRTENHHRVNWKFLDYSPFNPQPYVQ